MTTYPQRYFPICPSWPNSSEPSNEKDAITAIGYMGIQTVSTCRWKDTEPGAVQLASNPGTVTLSLDAHTLASTLGAKKKKFIYCETHHRFAEKLLVKQYSAYYRIRDRMDKYWKQDYVKDPLSQYGGMKLVMRRRIIVDTMSKMW